MFDVDLALLIFRECDLISYGLRTNNPYTFAVSDLTWNVTLFSTLSLYYVGLLVYCATTYSDANIQPIVQPIIEQIVVNNPVVVQPLNIDVYALNSIFFKYRQFAHQLMIENNARILVIAYETISYMDDASSQIAASNQKFGITFEQISNIFKNGVVEGIKNDEELYNKLLRNDYIVDYIARVVQKGFNERNIPGVLGFDLEF